MANRSPQGWKQPEFGLDVIWCNTYLLALICACNTYASKHCINLPAVLSFLMLTHGLAALYALKLCSTSLVLPLVPKH